MKIGRPPKRIHSPVAGYIECSCCHLLRQESFFSKSQIPRQRCKACTSKISKKWWDNNKEYGALLNRKWSREHPDALRARYQRYVLKPGRRARRLLNSLKWAKNNPQRCAVNDARRRAKKLSASPAWANDFFIQEIYDLARRRTKALGIKHHVDHIVPLVSKLVCGLHTEANLRVIPQSINARKSCFSWPDMP